MPFISQASHRKFIQQCQLFINNPSAYRVSECSEDMEKLKQDLLQLQALEEAYAAAVARLSGLTREYNQLQGRIRVKLRRMQMMKMAVARRR